MWGRIRGPGVLEVSMLQLKPISEEAIPAALAKAERYRLLQEPREAESIYRDVVCANPGDQKGLAGLLLALTDQFDHKPGVHVDEARQLLPRLRDEYERAYYEGVILERWGKAQQVRGSPAYVVLDWLRAAMACFEKAEAVRPAGNDDAILRWNACCRLIMRETFEEETRSQRTPNEADAGFSEEVPLI